MVLSSQLTLVLWRTSLRKLFGTRHPLTYKVLAITYVNEDFFVSGLSKEYHQVIRLSHRGSHVCTIFSDQASELTLVMFSCIYFNTAVACFGEHILFV